MTEINETLGTISQDTNYYRVTITRHLEHDRDRVWEMLTDPAQFVNWLAPGSIELFKGGKANLNFGDSGIIIDSEVSECEIPSLLEYSWSSGDEPTRPIRWALEATENGTQLNLTLGIPLGEDLARSCAGWEAHLMMLLAAIEGVPIKFPFERFVSSREAYKKILSA